MYAKAQTVNILGIDPGTSILGMAIINIDAVTFEILKIEPISINVSNGVNLDIFQDDVISRLMRLKNVIEMVLRDYAPIAVSIEAGFINLARPGAFGPLSKALMVIENAVIEYNRFVKVFKFPPSVIKNAVGAKLRVKKTDPLSIKDEMSLAITRIPELACKFNPFKRTEHEVDGVAISYTLVQEIRRTGGLILWV